MDGYGGISRGKEQVTVRASRRLSRDPGATTVGPLRYEVVEPLRTVRFALDANDCQPIAFEWEFHAVVPPFLEERTHTRQGVRVVADLVRYHQVGTATGWAEVDGRRIELDGASWVSTRDHSWGVRQDVGPPEPDAVRRQPPPEVSYLMLWCPLAMRRPDGTWYGLFLHLQQLHAGGTVRRTVMGGVEHTDGRMDPWVDLDPDLRFDPTTRRLLGGTVLATTGDGTERPLTLRAVSDTGFHLGAGLYFGFDGHYHGERRGELHVDGERIPDCTDPTTARRLHQLRDTVVHVVDPVGGGEGWGNCQPIVTGAFPRFGLPADGSFL